MEDLPCEPARLPDRDLAAGTSLEKLDRVMVLGFPSGDTLHEAGRAEASVSLGTVRRVEETIQISAPLIPGNSGGPLSP